LTTRRALTLIELLVVISISVKLHTLLDETAVLTPWLQIGNTSNDPVALTAIAHSLKDFMFHRVLESY